MAKEPNWVNLRLIPGKKRARTQIWQNRRDLNPVSVETQLKELQRYVEGLKTQL